jgi:hypothetical protein
MNTTLAAATASISSGEINAPTFAAQQQIRHEITFVFHASYYMSHPRTTVKTNC